LSSPFFFTEKGFWSGEEKYTTSKKITAKRAIKISNEPHQFSDRGGFLVFFGGSFSLIS